MNPKTVLADLLTDLYNAYNPSWLEYVPALADRYNGMAYAAIDMIFIKYNKKSSQFYNPEYDTPEFKIKLIRDYDNGLRPFQGKNFVENVVEPVIESSAESQEKIKNEIESVVTDLTESFKKKEQELFAAYNEKIKLLDTTKTSFYDSVDITVRYDVTEKIKNIPEKSVLVTLGTGARIISMTEEGKVIGLVIKEIICDLISGEKPIIELTIGKG